MPSHTKVTIETPASNKSSQPACNSSESDISTLVCCDGHASISTKSVADQSTTKTARASGRNGGICYGLGDPWLRPLDMRAETKLPGITHLGICSKTAQGEEASDTERIGSDTNPPISPALPH